MRKALLSFALFVSGSVFAADDYIAFQRLDVRSDGRKWMTASLQFMAKTHPNPKGALNDKFIDDVKVELYLCFNNEVREKKIKADTGRKPNLKETLDCYHAIVEIPTLEVDSRLKTLVFLLPLEIAKRDGFEREQKPHGYIVDISIGGASVELKDPVVLEGFRQEEVLKTFKEVAIENAAKNEGLLVPGHIVDITYLENAPAVKFPNPAK